MIVSPEKRRDFGSKISIIVTRIHEKTPPFSRGPLQGGVEDLLNPRPIDRRIHLLSSLFRKARASVQSRFTVAGEIPRASAVSSTPIPAKNRHSTTRA